MAPGVWDVDDLVEGGLASIEEFVGRLTDVDEDVEGNYGLQKELHFHDVEIIEAADDVSLDEGRYTCWVKQNNKKNSTDGRMIADWAEFCKAQSMGPMPSCLYGVLIRWQKATYEFGDEMSPGRAMIPVELMEEGGSKKSKSKSKAAPAKTSTKKAPPPPAEEPEDEDEEPAISEAVTTAIHGAIGEDGATREMIRRVFLKKAALRKDLAKFGTLEEVLEAMNTIEEDEGTYTMVEADEDDDPI